MPIAISNVKRGRAGRAFKLACTLTLSGTYPTGGDPVDFSSYIPHASAKQPDNVDVNGKAGFVYQYDYVNKKLFTRVNDAGGANAPMGEHTNATYVAGVSGDTITAFVTWLA